MHGAAIWGLWKVNVAVRFVKETKIWSSIKQALFSSSDTFQPGLKGLKLRSAHQLQTKSFNRIQDSNRIFLFLVL